MRESNLLKGWKPLENQKVKVKQHGFWLWANNGLCHEHWQAQPGQHGREGDGWDHVVPDFYANVYRKIKSRD